MSANANCNTTTPVGPAVTLSWTASSGGVTYDGYRNGSLFQSGIAGTSFNDINVAAGQTYTYDVVANNPFGATQSNAVTVMVPSTICSVSIPGTPTSLSPGSTSSPGPTLGSNAVTVSWNASSGAQLYIGGIYDIAAGSNVVTINTSGTSFSATLSPGKQYRWFVDACNSSGCSSSSAPYYFQTPGSASTAPPTATVSANPTTVPAGGQTTLTWSSTNATSCTASNGWSGSKATSGSQTATVSSTPGTENFGLSCTNGSGMNVYTGVNVTVTMGPTLTLTASPTSINIGQSSTLTWSSTNTSSCTASGGWSGSEPTSGNATVFPTSTTTYALNCNGTDGTPASASATVMVATPPATPISLSPGSTSSPGPTLGSSTVTVSWNASIGATSYIGGIHDIAAGIDVVTINTSGTSTTATLSPSKQYRWYVYACNSSGCSGSSALYYFQTP
jgi:hypothetical protein